MSRRRPVRAESQRLHRRHTAGSLSSRRGRGLGSRRESWFQRHATSCTACGSGFVVLVLALVYALRSPGTEALELQRANRRLEQSLAVDAESLAQVRRDIATQTAKLSERSASMERQRRDYEERYQHHNANRETQRARVNRSETELQQRARELGRRHAEVKAAAVEVEKRDQDERWTQDLLSIYRLMVVTVISKSDSASSGFLFSTPNGAVVVTSDEVVAPSLAPAAAAQPKDEPVVKFLYLPPDGTEDAPLQVAQVPAQIAHRDAPTRLAFLLLDLSTLPRPRDIRIPVFDSSRTATPERGAPVFAIGTQLQRSGYRETRFEHTVLAGQVLELPQSPTGPSLADLRLDVQPGTLGSPVFNRQGALLGVLVGEVDSKAQMVVAGELLRALRRMENALEARRARGR